MPVTAVVGANWGDEGKGKLCDYLAETADVVIRFQGGKNAGHTIINQYGKFALHLVPCGVCHAHTTNLLGPGVAVDVAALLAELAELSERGAPNPRVLIADRAQVVLPWHVELDRLEEARRGAAKFGSTQSGIAPFYADKYLKVGFQVRELFDAGHLRGRLEHTLPRINVLREHLYDAAPLSLGRVVEEMLALGAGVREMVVDSTALLQAALRDGKHLLLEGQLGALRDPDHGIYPYVTSSSPLAGFATVGAGVPAHAIDRVVATVKAYSSCVGAGPFTTELTGPCGDELRERGGDAGEYGATTGRPRRVGWFDAVATRYGCAVQGATELAVTLLDVLGYLDAIPVCTAYEVDGRRVDDFPATAVLERARPVYETLPGWRCDVSGARSFAELPPEAQSYVRAIETAAGIPVRWVSIGPRREQLIRISDRRRAAPTTNT